jgi:quinol---cytochrome c reductase iron-sulfur subunit, bacillus type
MSNDGIDRRTFYLTAIYGLWTLMGTALGVSAAIYLLLPAPPRKEDEWTEVGRLSQLQPGVPQELIFRRNRVDGWKVISEKAAAWVVKTADREVIAFAPQCPHLGCAYHWQQQNQHFLCPCHASTFSLHGEVLSGPSPRPLDRYKVIVEGNRLLLGPKS